MSNMSFNGLPIDSNWVATFQDQGRFGIALEAFMFLLLLVTAISLCVDRRRRSASS